MNCKKYLFIFILFIPLYVLVFSQITFAFNQCRVKEKNCRSCCEESAQPLNVSYFAQPMKTCCVFNSGGQSFLFTAPKAIQENSGKILISPFQVISSDLWVEKRVVSIFVSSFSYRSVPLFILKDSYLI